MSLYQLMGRTPVERVLANVNASYRPRYRLGDTASIVAQLLQEAEGILVAYCQKQGASATQCAQFQTQFTICKDELTAAISAEDIAGIATAGLCLNDLKEKIDKAFAEVPPPPPKPPTTPAPTSTGVPTWGLVLIGLGAAAVATTVVVVATRK